MYCICIKYLVSPRYIFPIVYIPLVIEDLNKLFTYSMLLCVYVWFDCHFYFFLSTLYGWLLFAISLGTLASVSSCLCSKLGSC